MILSIMYIPKYDIRATISKTIMNGIIPIEETRMGRLRHPVPNAEANIAKIDPLILPVRMGLYAPLTDGRTIFS